MNRRRLLGHGLWLGAALATGTAGAQAYPDRPITLVVPFPAGGAVDIIARGFGPPLAQELGQPVLIENIGGGSGSIGATKVARARADGYTLLVGTVNDVVLAPLINRAVPYQLEDFSPVAKIGESVFAVVGRPGLAARDFDELVAFARANPGKLTYATSGIGSLQHVGMEILQARLGISLLHVPYRGGTALVTDLLGGQVDLAMVVPGAFAEHLKNGKVRSYGTTSLQRDDALGGLATLNESQSLKGYHLASWIGVFAPAHTSQEVRQRVAVALQSLLGTPEQLARLRGMGLRPAPASEQSVFASAVQEVRTQMRPVVARMNLGEQAK